MCRGLLVGSRRQTVTKLFDTCQPVVTAAGARGQLSPEDRTTSCGGGASRMICRTRCRRSACLSGPWRQGTFRTKATASRAFLICSWGCAARTGRAALRRSRTATGISSCCTHLSDLFHCWDIISLSLFRHVYRRASAAAGADEHGCRASRWLTVRHPYLFHQSWHFLSRTVLLRGWAGRS